MTKYRVAVDDLEELTAGLTRGGTHPGTQYYCSWRHREREFPEDGQSGIGDVLNAAAQRSGAVPTAWPRSAWPKRRISMVSAAAIRIHRRPEQRRTLGGSG